MENALSPSQHAWEVGLIEVIALEEKRHALRAGKSVGKAVSEVEPCRMSTLPETTPCVDGEVNRLEARMWLDGPAAKEGRVGGSVRELFWI